MAQIFELHFNPKLREDLIFDSFCYEPENVYERRLGSLYIIGELKNALPQNLRFLDKLAQIIKGKYYAFPILSFEKNFEESLKRANEFLAEEVKKDNTSWLGNLSLAVISLKSFDLNFTRVGDLKIFLLRKGQITDIGERLEFQEIEPYPLKIFGNIATGKLVEDDQILILTKEAFEAFSKENLIDEVAKIPIEDKSYEKQLKKILKNKEKILSEISGICLLIILKPEFLLKKALIFEKEFPIFSFRQIFKPFVNKIRTIRRFAPQNLVSLLRLKISLKIPPKKIKEGVFHIPIKEKRKISPRDIYKSFLKKLGIFQKIKFFKELKKGLILILALIFFLLLGFFIFKKGVQYQLKESKINLNEIQKKVNLAENLLISKDEKKANSLFKEAWEEILPLTKEEVPLKDEALKLKEDIEENLGKLNKLGKITEPQTFFEFDPKKFLPQKMIIFGKELYFFSPISKNLFRINEKGEGNLIPTNEKFNLAATTLDNVLFFIKPDLIFPLEKEPFYIKVPYPDYDFIDFSSFKDSLYFLDGKTGEILKYLFKENQKTLKGELWLDPETKKVTDGKSMAIDGSVWILTKNEIYRYYGGKYQETLKFDLFPYPKNFEKIFTSPVLPYLYILEPAQNRIIILSKSGEIIRQFESEKFDYLKDFSVSGNGKIIYLLNGQKIYQVQFQ